MMYVLFGRQTELFHLHQGNINFLYQKKNGKTENFIFKLCHIRKLTTISRDYLALFSLDMYFYICTFFFCCLFVEVDIKNTVCVFTSDIQILISLI